LSATSVFVFGTLRDRDLLSLVCEQPVDALPSAAANLPGFEPRYVRNKVFPVLVAAPSSTAIGEVIEFDEELLERVIQYETDDFELSEISVRLSQGNEFNCYYFANIGFSDITDRLWTLDEWQLLHKEKWMTIQRSL